VFLNLIGLLIDTVNFQTTARLSFSKWQTTARIQKLLSVISPAITFTQAQPVTISDHESDGLVNVLFHFLSLCRGITYLTNFAV